jgi:spermidine synthase
LKATARRDRVLLANVLVVATCALVYELLCGTLASYLLGDAVREFALVLGTYLFAMGTGAWISRALEPQAARRYVEAEIALAIVGGLSVPTMLLGVEAHLPLRPLLYGIVFVVGALVGLELPLLIRILRGGHGSTERAPTRFADTIARAFAFDYAGALAASVFFPLVLVPRLGLVRTSVVAGALNVLAALSATFVLRARTTLARVVGTIVLVGLAVVFARADTITFAD